VAGSSATLSIGGAATVAVGFSSFAFNRPDLCGRKTTGFTSNAAAQSTQQAGFSTSVMVRGHRIQLQQQDSAELYYWQSLQQFPDSARVEQFLTFIALFHRDTSQRWRRIAPVSERAQVLFHFLQWRRQPSTDTAPLVLLRQCVQQMKQMQQQVKNKAVAVDATEPVDWDTRYVAALERAGDEVFMALLDRLRPQKLRRFLEAMIEQYPDVVYPSLWLARWLMQQQRWEEALAVLDRAAQQSLRHPELHQMRAEIAVRQKRYRVALLEMLRALHVVSAGDPAQFAGEFCPAVGTKMGNSVPGGNGRKSRSPSSPDSVVRSSGRGGKSSSAAATPLIASGCFGLRIGSTGFNRRRMQGMHTEVKAASNCPLKHAFSVRHPLRRILPVRCGSGQCRMGIQSSREVTCADSTGSGDKLFQRGHQPLQFRMRKEGFQQRQMLRQPTCCRS